jgi:NADH-quinone oxidoreductase subunit G
MAEMIKLFVNGQEVEVESGKNLIDAVGAVGIEIPHLCYHPALGADGNCRMCLVGIEDGRPPLVPACKTRAVEGMKVQLDTEKIKKIQRDIMELELINHPTDCPVCDQAGECQLQDYYMQYDSRESRMTVPQVAKSKNLDFGCGVVHDQERCILCARCVRFTHDHQDR